jgi:hypothetical protein
VTAVSTKPRHANRSVVFDLTRAMCAVQPTPAEMHLKSPDLCTIRVATPGVLPPGSAFTTESSYNTADYMTRCRDTAGAWSLRVVDWTDAQGWSGVWATVAEGSSAVPLYQNRCQSCSHCPAPESGSILKVRCVC